MKAFNENHRAAALEAIITALNEPADRAEHWMSGRNLSCCGGWDGSPLTPMTRAAFVAQYGETVTAELEAAARAKIAERAEIGKNYRAHAAEADANAGKTPDALKTGDFVWCLDCGLKCDHQNLTRQLEHMVDGERDDADGTSAREYGKNYRAVNRRLCRIDRVSTVANLAEALKTWTPQNSEGGSRSDDVPEDWLPWGTDESPADRDAKLATFYTLGVLVRDAAGAGYLIDAEGFDYPRYVLFPMNYRDLFAVEITEITARREQERLEAKEAARAKEAADRAEYDARVAKWAPHMVPLLVFDPMDYHKDWRENVRRTKANVLTMAKIAAPGVRFTLRRSKNWGEGYILSWTNGPTVDELKAVADFGLFCVGRDTFDSMTDCAEYEGAKYTDFSAKYGGISNGVDFERTEAETDRNRQPDETATELSADMMPSAARWSENPEKNGVELHFMRKPDAATLERVKAAGWRWSRFAKCWYTRASDEARAFAREIVANVA